MSAAVEDRHRSSPALYGRGWSMICWSWLFSSRKYPWSAFASPVVTLVVAGSRTAAMSAARKLAGALNGSLISLT